MTKKPAMGMTILTVALITATSFGCAFDKYVEIAGGEYVPVSSGSLRVDEVVSTIKGMTVDKDKKNIEIELESGSIIGARFTGRPRDEWPSGCPANIGSTKMEVIDLSMDTLSIGPLVFHNPVLVRDCPSSPEVIVLREDGLIGGSGTACAGNDMCIHFKPGIPLEPLQSPREMTAEEKDNVIQIAISSSELQDHLRGDSDFEIELKWIARISEQSGSVTLWQIDYDWNSDSSFGSVPKSAVWYPAVLIQFDAPGYEEMLVAVDMNQERVVYIHEDPDVTKALEPAQGLPDINGRITDVQAVNNCVIGRVLVELNRSDGTSDKYWVAVNQDTMINDYRAGTREILSFEDLAVGQQVQIWFDGPVAESYPAQVEAKQIDLVLAVVPVAAD